MREQGEQRDGEKLFSVNMRSGYLFKKNPAEINAQGKIEKSYMHVGL